jgi:hypothetical protein
MFGMSEYLMIAHEVEKARQLSRRATEDHRGKESASAGSTARKANTQERRSRDE